MNWKALILWAVLSKIGDLVGMLGRRIVRKYVPPEDIPTDADPFEIGATSDFNDKSARRI